MQDIRMNIYIIVISVTSNGILLELRGCMYKWAWAIRMILDFKPHKYHISIAPVQKESTKDMFPPLIRVLPLNTQWGLDVRRTRWMPGLKDWKMGWEGIY